MLQQSHSSILEHRGMIVKLFPPPRYYYVYLLHYHSKYFHAQHYSGSTCGDWLDYRLARHKAGTSGARLPQVFHDARIPFTLARLWRFENAEEAFCFERKIKRAGHGPRYCPICNPRLDVDDHVFMRQGHHRLAWRFQQARPRRPMTDYCIL